MTQKTIPKKLSDTNIAKYYLLKLTLYLSRQKGRDSLLVQKRGKKNVMQPMFICTTDRVS